MAGPAKLPPHPVFGAFGAWLDAHWEKARHVRDVIHDTRFSFFVVLTAVVALLLNDQGREIAVRGGDSPWDLLWYPLSTGLLAFQVWFWARIILSIEHPRVPGTPESIVVNHFPRWLGVAAALIPIAAVGAAWIDGQAGKQVFALLILLVITLVLFAVFVIKRRDLAKRMVKDDAMRATLDSAENAYNRIFMWLSLAQVLGLTAWAWASPHSLGMAVGAAPVLLLGLATIVPIGSYLVLKTHGSKFPMVSFLVVSGLVLSSCDPHYLRELDSLGKDTRLSLAEEFAGWKTASGGDERPTMIVVSASGGGITAAYWTSSVLSQLQKFDPRFTSRLFSISAVSGGSVGTAAFTQALACEAAAADELQTRIEGALHGDLLAPTIGTALFNDMLFWFPPASILAHYEIKKPDRAATFEQQLESQWRAQFPGSCAGLDASFLDQRRTARERQQWRPIMLLNSTHQETGRPVVISQARLTSAGPAQPFESAIDFFTVAPHDLRISTAALNSARFPLVSPAGQIRSERDQPDLRIGHLIDGGYYENDGAFTTLKLLESLSDELANVRVIVIQISIDPPAPFERPVRTDPPRRHLERSYLADRVAHQPHFANELLAPLYGFVATRQGHQAAARDALRRWATTRGENAVYVHFRALIPRVTEEQPNPAEPPLGWLLSVGSETQLSRRTLCLDRNYAQWKTLSAALGVSAEQLAPCGASEPLHKEIDPGFPPIS